MIEIKNLTKTFDSITAVDNLSFQIRPGSVMGLVGSNGGGKSTLLRLLSGVYCPDSGEIIIDGEILYDNPSAKGKCFFVPDFPYYYNNSTIENTASLYRDLYPNWSENEYRRLCSIFPVSNTARIINMSKGMQRQAALILALSTCPRFLYLDEVFDGLDPVMRRAVWGLILADVAERGTTVLVSSHNLRELEDVCDHVGIMNNGKMLLERTLTELQDNIVKIQLAYADGGDVPEGLEILHESAMGRLRTLILRGKSDELQQKLAATQPLFLDVLPLTLEEIFIYELGGAGHALSDMVL